MLVLNRWQTGPALVVTLGLVSSTIAPLTLASNTLATPAPQTVAQLFPSSARPINVTIPAGTRLPVKYTGADRILAAPNETIPLTLAISRNVRTSAGELLIPAGSQVAGRLQPVGNGSQFIADTLTMPNGQRIRLNARSNVIDKRQEVQPGVNGDALIKGSAIGAGAATILSGVLGNRRITVGRVLAGAGAGALGGLLFGKRKAEVIVINSESDLLLTLDSGLTLARNY